MEGERVVAGDVLADLSEYLDNQLASDRRAQIDDHLRGRANCERFGGEFSVVVAALRHCLANPEPLDETSLRQLRERLRQELSWRSTAAAGHCVVGGNRNASHVLRGSPLSAFTASGICEVSFARSGNRRVSRAGMDVRRCRGLWPGGGHASARSRFDLRVHRARG